MLAAAAEYQRKGRCTAAFRNLLSGAMALAAADAHLRARVENRTPWRVVGWERRNVLMAKYVQVHAALEKSCIRESA